MVYRIVNVALILGILLTTAALSGENQGAGQITLQGGSRGTVLFPHRQHQETLGDCALCHTLFPKEAGSIEKLKDQGGLTGKQVMNTLCIKCHRAEQKAGNKSGPTMCSQCHVKG